MLGDRPMRRWTQDELVREKAALEAIAPENHDSGTFERVVDSLVQRYLPPEDQRTEADWRSARRSMLKRMARARAERNGPPSEWAPDGLAALHQAPEDTRQESGLTIRQQCELEYGAAHCAENIVDLTEAERIAIRQTIMEYLEAGMRGDWVRESLETQLFDRFGHLNRDWRRIALTEAGEVQNQGLIASLRPGRKVRRVERNCACDFCRSIDGRIMEVISPDSPDKDGERHVWVGKTNVGRSASRYRQDGDLLVERASTERWWIAAGIMHPNCRGRWVPIEEPRVAASDPKFSQWMDEYLERT